MTEYQYFRRSMPDPNRRVYSAGRTIAHYYHTDTHQYLGSEDILGDQIVVAEYKHPPACTKTDICMCRECYQESKKCQ